MKKLFIITQHYPYGTAEKSFIEPELKMLAESDKFDITVISNETELTQATSNPPPNVKIVLMPYRYTYKHPIKSIKYALNFFSSSLGRDEICEIIGRKTKIISRILESIFYYIRASLFEEQLRKSELEFNDSIVYTYWMYTQTLGIIKASDTWTNAKIVTRIHGFDLYDERTRSGRQCFRRFMNERLDRIFFIADTGKKYYLNQVRCCETEKYQLSRLGVVCKNSYVDICQLQKRGKEKLMVSCSRIIPLKRIEKIIEGLAEITENLQIRWIHFGDGPERNKIEMIARKFLDSKNGIHFEFRGNVSNEKIVEFYMYHIVDCFITTSESEGCPVSIQEALAYGIPIVATNVGDISYMVNGNGILLPQNSDAKQIAKAIEDVLLTDDEKTKQMRINSRKLWKQFFDAEENYSKFISLLEKV